MEDFAVSALMAMLGVICFALSAFAILGVISALNNVLLDCFGIDLEDVIKGRVRR